MWHLDTCQVDISYVPWYFANKIDTEKVHDEAEEQHDESDAVVLDGINWQYLQQIILEHDWIDGQIEQIVDERPVRLLKGPEWSECLVDPPHKATIVW